MTEKPRPDRTEAPQEIGEKDLESVAGGITAQDDWEASLTTKPKPKLSFGGDEWDRKGTP